MSDAVASLFAGLREAASSPIFSISVIFSIVVAIVYHWAVARPTFGAASRRGPTNAAPTSPNDLTNIRSRIAALEAASENALQCIGFVRFNAFPDVGSDLSYALAVVNRNGNGFLISSLYSREEVRTYAKAVQNFASDKGLNEEERRAIQLSRDQAQGRHS